MRDISYPQRTRFLPVAAFSVLLAVFAPSVFADDVRTSRAPVPFRFSEACWIWAEPKSDPPTNAYFRIVFDVTNDVRRAWFHSVLERNRGFWVNGKRVVLKSVEENRRCGGLVRAVRDVMTGDVLATDADSLVLSSTAPRIWLLETIDRGVHEMMVK